ncbi:LEAF RUST 10 DISEASE-RESISTANCE LOCUS RECEPTOR-LIKE PROTEIN KINASE-like 2.8 [Dirofilaria immitis]
MIFIIFNNHFQLNASSLIRYIFIAQIILSSLIIVVITEQLSFNNLPFQQSYYQRFDRSQQGIQKNFQFQQQQFPSYLRHDMKKINSKLGNNYDAKFINIPINNLNDTIGALVTIQLQEYNNPNLALPNGYTCICPSDMQCPYLQDGSITCFFSFTIILSASNQTVQIIESPFVMVPKSSINSGIWTNDNIINMTVKPNTIDIIVHHLGVVINQETGNLEYFNHLTPIDTFAILLDNYQSTPYGTAPNIIQRTIIGQILGTTLQLTYYIQCINNKYGPNCDLKCTPSLYDNTHSVCISIITGMYYSCKYAQDSVKVLDCTLCPYGLVANQTECIISNISSIISENNTSSVFRIWTIVLGCLLGIAIIFIILLVVIFTMVQRRHKMFTANRRRVKSNKTLLPWKNEEWQRSKIKATTRDSGVTSRIATSEERIEDQYIRNNIISTTRRREAHV